jgi:hypothetical protein
MTIGSANVDPYYRNSVQQVDQTLYSTLLSLLLAGNSEQTPAESQYQRRYHHQGKFSLVILLNFNGGCICTVIQFHNVFLNIFAARPYYGPVAGSSYYSSYYPMHPPQADYYRPTEQQEDESGLEIFRSGSEPRFFGLKKVALSGLISALRGPPGK